MPTGPQQPVLPMTASHRQTTPTRLADGLGPFGARDCRFPASFAPPPQPSWPAEMSSPAPGGWFHQTSTCPGYLKRLPPCQTTVSPHLPLGRIPKWRGSAGQGARRAGGGHDDRGSGRPPRLPRPGIPLQPGQRPMSWPVRAVPVPHGRPRGWWEPSRDALRSRPTQVHSERHNSQAKPKPAREAGMHG